MVRVPAVLGVHMHDVAGNTILHQAFPSDRLMIPVGTPDPGGLTLTLALTLMGCSTSEGFGVCATMVAVVALREFVLAILLTEPPKPTTYISPCSSSPNEEILSVVSSA